MTKHSSFSVKHPALPPGGGISGSTLKVLAVSIMFIDHFAAAFLQFGFLSFEGLFDVYGVYFLMRKIGRTAFLIFCFLLIEGFFHTRSRKKYLVSLLIFALLSEPFFDLALYNPLTTQRLFLPSDLKESLSYFLQGQNVYFTLFLGLSAVCLIDRLTMGPLSFLLSPSLALIFMVLAEVLRTDYGFWGVLLILLFYYFRRLPLRGGPVVFLLACLLLPLLGNSFIDLSSSFPFYEVLFPLFERLSLFDSELYAFPAVLLIGLYNGKRGFLSGRAKYFFYLFYPVHLLFLYLLRIAVF